MEIENSNPEKGWAEEASHLFIDYGRYFVPDRERQIGAIAALVPRLEPGEVAFDLACGEGLLAEAILAAHPSGRVFGLDGSAAMLGRARERLARFGERFTAAPFDLFDRTWPVGALPARAVVSSLAIHHLDGPQKMALYAEILGLLAPGGAFFVVDLIAPAHPSGWALAADAWDEAVRERALALDGSPAAFEVFERERWNTYRYFDPQDIDRPSGLFDQLKWLEAAGFTAVDVYWMRAGHVLFGGYKPGA